MHNDDTLHNLEQSIEFLRGLVRTRRAEIRRIEHERDMLLAWYRAPRGPAAAALVADEAMTL